MAGIDPEAKRIAWRKYQQSHREIVREKSRRWKAKNREHLRQYAKDNAGKYNAYCNKRRAAKIRATPPWANMKKIMEIYMLSAEMTKSMGIKYVVDHIYPLQSKLCCGLHVSSNLRIITHSHNSHKFNSIPEKGEDYSWLI
jgi:hypothetical protein